MATKISDNNGKRSLGEFISSGANNASGVQKKLKTLDSEVERLQKVEPLEKFEKGPTNTDATTRNVLANRLSNFIVETSRKNSEKSMTRDVSAMNLKNPFIRGDDRKGNNHQPVNGLSFADGLTGPVQVSKATPNVILPVFDERIPQHVQLEMQPTLALGIPFLLVRFEKTRPTMRKMEICSLLNYYVKINESDKSFLDYENKMGVISHLLFVSPNSQGIRDMGSLGDMSTDTVMHSRLSAICNFTVRAREGYDEEMEIVAFINAVTFFEGLGFPEDNRISANYIKQINPERLAQVAALALREAVYSDDHSLAKGAISGGANATESLEEDDRSILGLACQYASEKVVLEILKSLRERKDIKFLKDVLVYEIAPTNTNMIDIIDSHLASIEADRV